MDWTLFQLACLAVLAFAYGWLLWQSPDRKRTALLIVLIAFAAWLAEDTAILRYRFYFYPDGWWLKIDQMPILVAFIWPMVILSSRALVERLFPGLGPAKMALFVGVAVFIDASLVETIAVASGLWTWVEGGYLGVPLIGMLGWGAFAAAMTWSLEHPKVPLWLSPLTALAGTHLLLVVLWWSFFRILLRDTLPDWTTWIAVAALLGLALYLRRRGRRFPLNIAVPRIAATSVFVVLLFLHASLELVLHFAAVAAPYLATLGTPVSEASPDHPITP